MNRVNIEQVAESCVKKFQASLDIYYHYAGTLYAAISVDNKVFCSQSPHVLNNAHRCILIHKKEGNGCPDVYKLNYINENFCVTDGFIDKSFYLIIKHTGPNYDFLVLQNNDYDISFDFSYPFEDKLQKIWNIYCKVKDAKSKEEIILLKKIIENEKKQSEIKAELDSAYHLLDELNSKYRKLFDDIKSLVE